MSNHFDPRIHHRRSIRLNSYDYSQAGAYFITVVAFRRACLFGDIVDGDMKLSQAGKIVEHAWFDLPGHYPHVELNAFVIMPNHIHGILILNGRGGSISGNEDLPEAELDGGSSLVRDSKTRPYKVITRHALPEIIRALKSFSAQRINLLRHTQGIPVWQRSYYEHIIRNEREMDKIWRYIEFNPQMWMTDDENPSHL